MLCLLDHSRCGAHKFLPPFFIARNELKLTTSDCACPGHIQIYVCNVVGSRVGTAVWQGTALNCEVGTVIHLLHSEFTSERGAFGTCNGGAIVGKNLRIENNQYISQLNVTLSSDMNGETIECVHDDGTTTNTIGSYQINLTTGMVTVHINILNASWISSIIIMPTAAVPLPPIDDITWTVVGSILIFHWSPVGNTCPAIRYEILASDCGSCPNKTTQTTVTCVDVPSGVNICTFAAQAVICGNITGNTSSTVTIALPIQSLTSVTPNIISPDVPEKKRNAVVL